MSGQQERPMSMRHRRKILGPCAVVFGAADTGSWRIERPEVDAERCSIMQLLKRGLSAVFLKTDMGGYHVSRS